MSAPDILLPVAILLAMACFGLALVALHYWRRAEIVEELAENLMKAELAAHKRARTAEIALDEIRMKRSLAVSKGNRRRAELHRARVLETTAAVAKAVKRKRQSPQGALEL